MLDYNVGSEGEKNLNTNSPILSTFWIECDFELEVCEIELNFGRIYRRVRFTANCAAQPFLHMIRWQKWYTSNWIKLNEHTVFPHRRKSVGNIWPAKIDFINIFIKNLLRENENDKEIYAVNA